MALDKNTLDELRIHRVPVTNTRSKTPLVLGIVVILVLAGLGYVWFSRPRAVEVHVATVRENSTGGSAGGARTVLNASGYVTARRAATVSSKVTAKVMEVLVEEGKHVQEGQVLARLDDTNTRASVQLAEAQIASAKSALNETAVRLKEAELQLKRTEELIKAKIMTASDLEHAEADAHSLKARLDNQTDEIKVAEKQLSVWQQQIEDCVIRAPFDGIVISKNAQPGEMISPMSAGGFTRTGICTIVDMSSLEIEVDVNESYINRVVPSQPVEAKLDAYPEWLIPCKVIAIIPTADRQKATVKVRVGFDKLDPRLLPDMGVKVAFHETEAASNAPASRSVSVTAPKSALQSVEGHDVVFVVRNGRVERRAVTVSLTQNDEAVFSAGLTAGESVVVDVPTGLADGAAIKIAKP